MRIHWVCIVGLFSTFSACKTTRDEVDLKHAENDVSALADPLKEPWRWHDTTDDEAQSFVRSQAAAFNDLGIPTILPATDPKARKVMEVAKRVDQSLRTRYGSSLAGIPKPKFLVVDADRPNGLAAMIPVCLAVPVVFADAFGENASSDDSRRCGVFTPGGSLVRPPITKFLDDDHCPCVEQVATKETLQKIVDWMNGTQFDRKKTQCRLSLDDASAASMKIEAHDCTGQSALVTTGLNHLDKLTYFAMSSVLAVTSGTFTVTSNEDQFAFIVAHELGHYYRAHGNPPVDSYDYFYKIPVAPAPGKPAPEANLEAFGRLVQKITPPLQDYTVLPGGKLKMELVDLLGSFVAERLKDFGSVPTTADCAATTDAWTAISGMISVAGANSSSGSDPTAEEKVGNFEHHLMACLGKLRLEDSVPSTILHTVNRPVRELLQEYADNIQGPARGGHFLIACSGSLPATGDLDSLATRINAALESEACDRKAIVTRAQSLPLGWYTVEQEADEIALEYMCRDGRTPESGVMAALAFFEFKKASPPVVNPPAELKLDCRGMREGHWTSGFVPIGDYREVHHGNCFRAQNLDRELVAHAYQCSAGLKDKGPDPAWKAAFPSSGSGVIEVPL